MPYEHSPATLEHYRVRLALRPLLEKWRTHPDLGGIEHQRPRGMSYPVKAQLATDSIRISRHTFSVIGLHGALRELEALLHQYGRHLKPVMTWRSPREAHHVPTEEYGTHWLVSNHNPRILNPLFDNVHLYAVIKSSAPVEDVGHAVTVPRQG